MYMYVHTFCALDEPVDLWHGDDMSKHVTEPLRINKVEMTEGRCVIMKHDACRVCVCVWGGGVNNTCML